MSALVDEEEPTSAQMNVALPNHHTTSISNLKPRINQTFEVGTRPNVLSAHHEQEHTHTHRSLSRLLMRVEIKSHCLAVSTGQRWKTTRKQNQTRDIAS